MSEKDLYGWIVGLEVGAIIIFIYMVIVIGIYSDDGKRKDKKNEKDKN